MKQEVVEPCELSYAPCRYGNSKILFRGPRRRLDLPYLACVGGTETFGKYIAKPFPVLIEKAMRQTCVNLGYVNGGIDVFNKDSAVIDLCRNADLTILQVMGAGNLSNRFYSVHPRRNDRFLQASTVLKAIYQDVDFSQFSFTRHMLGALHAQSPSRFEIVVEELRKAWVWRMKNLLEQIGKRVILLWFSEEPLSNADWAARPSNLQADPLFVTAAMVDELRPYVLSVTVSNPSPEALAEGCRGMVYPQSQSAAASEMLGVRCHQEVSVDLVQAIREQLYSC